jgi:GNAT superfamily N-acetyltransferase
MGDFTIRSAFSEKLTEIRRLISQGGFITLLQLIFAYVVYHLSGKWHFIYFEFSFQQPIPSFILKESISVRIAAPNDMGQIRSEIFPLLQVSLSNDKRYFHSVGQPNIKCFLAEKDETLVHYSWVFMDVFNSLLMEVPFDKNKLRQGDAFIGPVFTSPSARGLVYLHVLSVILDYLQVNNYANRVLLFVDGRNAAAVSFYTRLGFKEIIDAQPTSIFSFCWRRLKNALI